MVSEEGLLAGLKGKRLTKDAMETIALNLPASFKKETKTLTYEYTRRSCLAVGWNQLCHI